MVLARPVALGDSPGTPVRVAFATLHTSGEAGSVTS